MLIAASTVLAATAPFAPLPVAAYPLQRLPGAAKSPSPTPDTVPANMLPLGTSLAFILDDTISSANSKAGQTVRAHLEHAMIVNGTTVAPAGTPVEIKITDASPASNPDIYGFVDIYIHPMKLPDGRSIPLHPPAAHLNINTSSGHDSTVDVEDTIGDLWAPTLLLHVFRKGRNFTLEPGARIRALTDATIVVSPDGTVAINTPAPLVLDADTPVSSFKAVPMATGQPSYSPALTPPPLTPNTPHP
ncbi:MAG TPA: hypothetical protein VMA98_05340 [Candidatus Acidoferrales bacterium]|nr:hypothetical protein [Candidatus Acidoferrales bacterium]